MAERPTGRRGVSEVLGYVFIFGMVLTSIIVVTSTGQAGLLDVREDQQLDNAEHSFDILADSIDDLLWHQAPSRATEVKLTGAQLSMGDPVTVNVTAHPVDNASATSAYEYQVRPIIYDASTGTELVYANGAVLRQDPGGTALRRAPRLLFTSHQTTLPVIQTRAEGAVSVGGATNAQVQTRRVETEVVIATSEPTVVNYSITSPRAAAWRRHLSDAHPAATCSQTNQTVTCSVTTDHATVTVVRIDVALKG